MTARRLIIGLGILLCAGVVFAVVRLSTVKVRDEGPGPFAASLPFAEPPVVSSHGGRLKTTLVAKNGTVRVGGLKVANTQTYAAQSASGSTVRGLLGPTLHVRPGDTIDLTLDSRLVAPQNLAPAAQTAPDCSHSDDPGSHAATAGQQFTNLHFHGLHVTPRTRRVNGAIVYGDNVLLNLPRGRSHIEFMIPKDHPQGTYWYHAHRHQCTDDQVYRGLAGLLLIGDSRRDLPARFHGITTRSLALKDIQVSKHAGGYAIPGNHTWSNPTHRTVNGLVNPIMRIRPGETQLWRLANTSSAVWYRVALVDEQHGGARDPFQIVAEDGNPRVRPVLKTEALLAPGNRFDVLVRGPRSGQRILKTLPFDQGHVLFPEDVLATLDVAGSPEPRLAPATSHGRPVAFPKRRGPARRFVFSIDVILSKSPVTYRINHKVFDPNRVDAAPTLGTVERWTLVNTSGQWHPFHIHQDDFRVISINGKPPPPVLRGEHDIVALPPRKKFKPGTVVIDMPFTEFSGKFVFHCHILDHEDGGMMALVDVRRPRT